MRCRIETKPPFETSCALSRMLLDHTVDQTETLHDLSDASRRPSKNLPLEPFRLRDPATAIGAPAAAAGGLFSYAEQHLRKSSTPWR